MIEINMVSKNFDKMRNIAALERIRSKTQQTPTKAVHANLFSFRNIAKSKTDFKDLICKQKYIDNIPILALRSSSVLYETRIESVGMI